MFIRPIDLLIDQDSSASCYILDVIGGCHSTDVIIDCYRGMAVKVRPMMPLTIHYSCLQGVESRGVLRLRRKLGQVQCLVLSEWAMTMIIYWESSRRQSIHYADSEEAWKGEEVSLPYGWTSYAGVDFTLIAAIVTYMLWAELLEDVVSESCFAGHRDLNPPFTYCLLLYLFHATLARKRGDPFVFDIAHLASLRDYGEEVLEQIPGICIGPNHVPPVIL